MCRFPYNVILYININIITLKQFNMITLITLIKNEYLDKSLIISDKKILYSNTISWNQIILSIHSLQDIKVRFNNEIFNINTRFTNILLNIENTEIQIEIEITCLYGLEIKSENIIYLLVQEYGFPQVISLEPYNFIYSFDFNYYQGAFASINSLLVNLIEEELTNKISKINKININLLIPKNEYSIVVKKLLDFILLTKSTVKFSIYLIDNNFLNEEISKTQCFKGSGHLLKLSNYSRLIIGHIINTEKILYLDSDTIVCSDLTKILDKTDNNFVIKGKKSKLNYYNLFNNKNIQYFKKENFDFDKNIIYTGTLLINPFKYKKYFDKMLDVVKIHNEILHLGGLYKLFTMSIINIGMEEEIKYFDDILVNTVDLGYNKNIDLDEINKADVLDWSGVYKPWFTNGLYQEYWKKYNIFYKIKDSVIQNKNGTVESL
jgi:lipopolysaccharide biosynthesis glycosyltransferase